MTLSTFRQFAEQNPAFSEGSLRWIRLNQEQNGFAPAFKKVGGRVFIQPETFFGIVKAQTRQAPDVRSR